MLVADFDFELPKELIAQEPPAVRGTSRLLVLDRATGQVTHQSIGDLPAWLHAGDLMVVNDTKVFPARLLGHRVPSGGAVECLLLERLDDTRWDALVHPGQKLKPGARFLFGAGPQAIHGEIVDRASFGRRTVALRTEDGRDIDDAIDAIGHMPLPPYIHRDDTPSDLRRYQTVYARVRGSVAAPTAGLHFTPELLLRLEQQGVERAIVTLHVGYGTFKPVRTDIVEEHTVDPEHYAIGEEAADRINATKKAGRRVLAVGTTTVRTLETAGARSETGVVPAGAVQAGTGTTDLFLRPGHAFHVVDALLTNFHLPRSSLLMLVCAFAGRERVLAAYREAVAAGYRFYSYGDAMLIV
jgi:S-adenosylmethionine:tRNA ribosyltransferase-isomerase